MSEMELKLKEKDKEIDNLLAKLQALQDRNAVLELEKGELNNSYKL